MGKGFVSGILLVLAITNLCSAAYEPHRITNLPECGTGCTLGTQYSGYIELDVPGPTIHFHYIFTEAIQNPHSAPLILWLNGGPGCSSLDGYFYEQGPFHFRTDYGRVLLNNNNTWVKSVNMIFLESPEGVGFSYKDDGVYNPTDNTTADHNLLFVKKFFSTYFPEYSTNDLYVAGESYAGIYVPMLAYRIANDAKLKQHFKGFMVGNGVTVSDYDTVVVKGLMKFLNGHGILDDGTYSDIVQKCVAPDSQACRTAVSQGYGSYNDYNIYNTYGDCVSQRPPPPAKHSYGKYNLTTRLRNVEGMPPCTDAFAARDYLNQRIVKQALHVNDTIQWTICSSLNYQQTVDSVVPIYEELRNKYKILVYSGDTDGCVPYTMTATWVESLNLPFKGTKWDEWYFNNPYGQQVGGRITLYEGLTFVTVRGSGHMVPQYRPESATAMLEGFLTGKWNTNTVPEI